MGSDMMVPHFKVKSGGFDSVVLSFECQKYLKIPRRSTDEHKTLQTSSVFMDLTEVHSKHLGFIRKHTLNWHHLFLKAKSGPATSTIITHILYRCINVHMLLCGVLDRFTKRQPGCCNQLWQKCEEEVPPVLIFKYYHITNEKETRVRKFKFHTSMFFFFFHFFFFLTAFL